MKELFSRPEFCVLLVLSTYLLGQWIFRKTKFPLFHPLIISISTIIAFLKLADIDYAVFEKGSYLISFLLGPSVVAIGYLLYEQLNYLKSNLGSILISVFIGSVVGILSVVVLAELTGASELVIRSLEPKSVTAPIAMSIVKSTGGDISLTAAVVVACGILGSMLGPTTLKLLGIESKIAKGLAMGSAAHGIGTARAIEMGAVEGAISGLAIGLMGIMTALLIPIFHSIYL